MRFTPTLSLYIIRQFVQAFALVLLVIMGLIMTFDMIELIRRAAGHGDIGFGVLLAMALLKLPQMTHTIMPFAVMIGAMIAFWQLTRTHELVVARAAGVSVWQFLAPVLATVLAIGVFETTVFNPLAAAMFARFQALQDEVLLKRGADQIDVSEVGLWLREGFDGGKGRGEEGGQIVVHADGVRQEGLELDLRDVHIFIYDRPDHFVRRLSADTARLVKGAFLLDDVWVMEPGKPAEHLAAMTLPTQLTLERVHDNFASPETLSFWQLPAFISFFEKAGFSAPKHRMYLQSLLAAPLLYCGMVLVAALFSLKPNLRSGGLALRIGSGVAAGFLLYFFSKLVYAFGLSQTVPQVLAAWAPALMSSFAGLGGLFHMEDG
jgi:lipopolysaccharide export system permease protein